MTDDSHPQHLVIVGAGGHAREVLDVVEALNAVALRYVVLGFLDDAPERQGQTVRGHRVLGGVGWLDSAPRDVRFVMGIGRPAPRRAAAERAARTGARPMAALVHPAARLTPEVRLADGCIVTAGAVLTSGITLAAHTHVNVAATISHDCVLGEYVLIGPGAHLAGNVRVDDGCEVGIGAVVIQGLHIGAWSIVGAGAAVVRSVESNVTVAGVPARVLSRRPPGWHEPVAKG
jgi:sugar O-acyltransferase (sialic acid O-acetyltransferase NeuD family)